MGAWQGSGPNPQLHAFTQPRRQPNLYPCSPAVPRLPPPAEALLPDAPPPASLSQLLRLMHSLSPPPATQLRSPPARTPPQQQPSLSPLLPLEPSGFTTPRLPVRTHRAGPEVEGPGEEPENPGRSRSSCCNKPAAVATRWQLWPNQLPEPGPVTSLPRA